MSPVNSLVSRRICGSLFLAYVAFSVLPLSWMVLLSLRPSAALFEPIWHSPTALTFTNYLTILTGPFATALRNSAVAAIGAATISMLIGVPAGFSLAKSRIAGRFVAAWLLLLLRMTPAIGFVIPLFIVYLRLHLIDSLAGLIIAYVSSALPLVVWVMWGSFAALPDDVVDAALVDGASVYGAFRKIALPLAAPGLVTAGILAFIVGWGDFFFALVLTRADASTGPVAVMNFLGYAQVNWGGLAAGGLLLTLPTLPMIFFINRFMVAGLTAGGVDA